MADNVTLEFVVHSLIGIITNGSSINKSFIDYFTDEELFEFYESYLEKQRMLVHYRPIAYVLGVLIIISNITVLFSSGLIIHKGQRPKSTYLLLGNVALADTMIGISMLFAASYRTTSTSAWCILQVGLLICPTLVSLFSVAFIAIDRYMFIVHGLYYQAWFNTRRVRIGIVCIWIIGGILGSVPATGWVNTDIHAVKCYYFSLFPAIAVLINGLVSILSILIVVTLNIIILKHALKSVDNEKGGSASKLRKFRGKNRFGDKDSKIYKMKSNSSFYLSENNVNKNEFKSHSLNGLDNEAETVCNDHDDSKMSIWTVASSMSEVNASIADDLYNPRNKPIKKFVRKNKEPNKWRAIIVITLTSGSFMITWLPYFVVLVPYVFCEHKLKNSLCVNLRFTLRGPLALLGYFNSVLNPLIYAWWHKGFKRFLKNYYSNFFNGISLCMSPKFNS